MFLATSIPVIPAVLLGLINTWTRRVHRKFSAKENQKSEKVDLSRVRFREVNIHRGTQREYIVQNHLNITLLNVF